MKLIYSITFVLAFFSLTASAQTADQRWPGKANLVNTSSKLTTSEVLLANDYIQSPNKQFYLALQEDGNVVIYNVNGKVIWSTGTNNKGGDVLRLQSDGNLCLYKKTTQFVWGTMTQGHLDVIMSLDDNGIMHIKSSTGVELYKTTNRGY
jgi:hypothetical protein